MAFAGHPKGGTACVLASQRPNLNVVTFEIPAGTVRVEIDRDAEGKPIAASFAAPQPLSMGETVRPEVMRQRFSWTKRILSQSITRQ